MKTSKTILTLLLALPMLLTGHSVLAAAANTLTLKFYDTNGVALTFAQVKTLQVGTKAGAYEADAFIDPATLKLIKATPLTDAGSFSVPLLSGQAVAFAINWPTARQGYGLAIMDNGGAGFTASTTIVFNYQAAKDLKRRLDAALLSRGDYLHSVAFDAAYLSATTLLAVADVGTDAVKGANGQLALDQLGIAYDLLLKEYGPVYAHAHISGATAWLGFTMEDVSNYKADVDKLIAMAGTFAWLRIVFQPGDTPADYTTAVTYAKTKGVKIMGLCVDSSADTGYTRAQYLQQYKTFIAAFPTIDCWEIGNEVNGGWSSSDIAARVADVTAYCKSQGKKTYLTLFWQLNTTDTTFSMFNWVSANLPPSVRTNLDYIGISQYQEQAPMGAAFDAVMRRLQVEFPTQKIGIGELGYWISGQQYWWAYNSNVTTAKDTVLAQYYNASLGYANANGGCFWWNFASSGSDYDFDSSMTNTIGVLKNALLAGTGSQTHSVPALLSYVSTGNGLRIGWPATTAGYLEVATSLSAAPATWTMVPTSQYQISGSQQTYTATGAVKAFYRLHEP